MEARIALLTNVFLRGSILVSKFIFVFVAAKFLTLKDMGTYSLVVATVSYSLFLVGLEFYTFATREVIGEGLQRQGEIILDQSRLYLASYGLFFIPLSAIFFFSVLDWKWAGFFYALLFTEHLSQEVTRLFIALGHPLFATILLFVRSASWAYIAIVCFAYDPSLRSVDLVMWVWLFGSGLSVGIAAFRLRFVPWESFFTRRLPLKWYVKGLKVAFPLLIASLAIRGLFTLDRYYVGWHDGLSMVGVYAVLIALCSGMLSFLDAGVFQFLYPRMVKAFKRDDARAFFFCFKSMTFRTAAFVGLFGTAFYFSVEFILSLLGKPEYIQHMDVFWLLFLAHALFVFSSIPQYGLYAMGKDSFIMMSHLIPSFFFVMWIFLVDIDGGMLAVSIGLCISFLLTFLIKLFGFIRYKPRLLV